MTLAAHVARWSEVASAELVRIKSKLPPSVLLAVWWRESRGTPGQRHLGGGAASGLGQITPIALNFYNLQHATSIAMADMRGTSENSIALQVRVSAYLLKWNVSQASRWLPDADPRDVYLVGLFAYHQGWPAVRRCLEQLQRKGVPLTWANLERYFPEGWQGKANPFRYAEGTLAVIEKIDDTSFEGGELEPKPLPRPPDEIDPLIESVSGIVIAGVLITLAGLVITVIALTRGSQ
jgi:hypothetical protein